MSATKKQWFIVRAPEATRWMAYELTEKQRARVNPQFKVVGPLRSLAEAMAKAFGGYQQEASKAV